MLKNDSKSSCYLVNSHRFQSVLDSFNIQLIGAPHSVPPPPLHTFSQGHVAEIAEYHVLDHSILRKRAFTQEVTPSTFPIILINSFPFPHFFQGCYDCRQQCHLTLRLTSSHSPTPSPSPSPSPTPTGTGPPSASITSLPFVLPRSSLVYSLRLYDKMWIQQVCLLHIHDFYYSRILIY